MARTPTVKTENPFESLRTAIACSSRDWAMHHRDAWIYGIVCGWDDDSLRDLAAQFGWGRGEVARLKRLRGDFSRASLKHGEP